MEDALNPGSKIKPTMEIDNHYWHILFTRSKVPSLTFSSSVRDYLEL